MLLQDTSQQLFQTKGSLEYFAINSTDKKIVVSKSNNRFHIESIIEMKSDYEIWCHFAPNKLGGPSKVGLG